MRIIEVIALILLGSVSTLGIQELLERYFYTVPFVVLPGAP
jgi:hypothetical protein